MAGSHIHTLKVFDISFIRKRQGFIAYPFKICYSIELFQFQQRVYTEADPEDLEIITKLADRILADLANAAQLANVTLPDDVELVLELVHFSDETICGYYFVNHLHRCLFWIELFDGDGICDEIKVVISESHLSERTS